MKDKILNSARERVDELLEDQVSRRIGTVGDLVAAEAMYRDHCCVKLFLKRAYTFLDHRIGCQYSTDEVMSAITGQKSSAKRTFNN